jgi:hypothetical protein
MQNIQVKTVLVQLAIVLALTGCATPTVLAPTFSEPYRLVEKNYSIGVRQRAAVGEPVIKLKDYYLERRTHITVRPTHDILMTREAPPNLTFLAGRAYPVTKTLAVGGVEYFVVPETTNPALAALVHPDGRIYPRPLALLGESAGLAWSDFEIRPEFARMLRDTEDRVVKSKGYSNFELIYNGSTGGSIFLTYREFTPEDLARTAFYQNLTYNASIGTIRFRKFRFQVHSANNETIEFTVLEDE